MLNTVLTTLFDYRHQAPMVMTQDSVAKPEILKVKIQDSNANDICCLTSAVWCNAVKPLLLVIFMVLNVCI